ncbi:accessory gland protein Acp29AB-like [Drosophila subpulchrella]|uniref:accessory gland protein Acp29AB-like n=1 Tax=Drosophila subpulchrella TaxID=1486046 RepID=UPI0018A1B564|nr:accessory gland protein Acp29AB-like [Drosophila subpulchrella]
MHKLETFFLSALVACNLYGMVMSQDETCSVCVLQDAPSQCGAYCLGVLQPLGDQIENIQKQLRLQATTHGTTLAILDTMQKNTQEKLEVFQMEMLKHLDQIKVETNERLDRIEAMIERRPVVTEAPKTNTIPPGFQRIGTRYFYIEEEIQKNWIDAKFFCLQKGGYLAAIQNQEEFDAVLLKLKENNRYWLGINDRSFEGVYISEASGNRAPFLKWFAGDPDNRDNYENCVGINLSKDHRKNATEIPAGRI